jgi:hypothetical protein
MKSNLNAITKHGNEVAGLTDSCNLYALNTGVAAAKLMGKTKRSKGLADKVRDLAEKTVVISGGELSEERCEDLSLTLTTLRELARKSRELRDEVKGMKNI